MYNTMSSMSILQQSSDPPLCSKYNSLGIADSRCLVNFTTVRPLTPSQPPAVTLLVVPSKIREDTPRIRYSADQTTDRVRCFFYK